MLVLSNISKTFNIGTQHQVKALSSINITFNPREWTYIIGGNGSGKTTLIKIIMGDVKPDDSGTVLLNNSNITKKDLHQRAHIFHYIEQNTDANLVNSMTIYENLILGLNSNGSLLHDFKLYKRKKLREKAKEILKNFSLNLEKRLDVQVRMLSGGEKQAVVAAKSMMIKPLVLLIDEFTSALDQKLAPRILRLLKEYTKQYNITVIIVTHDYNFIEDTGERVILLDNGKIVDDFSKRDQELTEKYILEKFHEQKNQNY